MAAALRIVSFALVIALAQCAHAQQASSDILMPGGSGTVRIPAPHQLSLLTVDPSPLMDLVRMPSPYSYQRLGIFCKAEVKMNRLFPVPVMIRLGEVERAEELEGKGVFRHLH
jgi:hypothetical protein